MRFASFVIAKKAEQTHLVCLGAQARELTKRIHLKAMKPSALIIFFMLTCIHRISTCPRGWKSLRNITKISKCYRLSKDKGDFFSALDACRNLDAEIVTIESHDENMLLQHLFYDNQPHEDEDDHYPHHHDDEGKFIWIGAMRTLPDNSNQSFRWIYGDRLTYSNWDMNEPSNEKENCAAMRSNGFWLSLYCYKKLHYVCEIDPGMEEKIKHQRLVLFTRELNEITDKKKFLTEDLDTHVKYIYILSGLSALATLIIAGQIHYGSFQWKKELCNLTNIKNEQENTYNNNFPSLNFEQ